MSFYAQFYFGFYCLVKKILPNEEYARYYAVAAMAGAATFLYFAATLFVVRRAATMLETAGVFLVLYAAHHYLFLRDDKKAATADKACSDRYVFRSILYFFTALSLLMYASSLVLK